MTTETYRSIQAIKEGEETRFLGVYMLKKRVEKVARNGSTFFMLELGDKTGSFTCFCFSGTPTFEVFRGLTEGAVVKVRGDKDFYQDRFSPKLLQARALEPSEWEPFSEHLIEVAPEPMEALWEEFKAFTQCIKDEGLKNTVKTAMQPLEERFKQCPGAIRMHHAYRHGLLEHTVHVARVCVALLPLYPMVHADLALAGVLLHDIGKVLEYEGELKAKKSQLGALQGHVVLGYRVAREAALKVQLDPVLLERLEHIILSHQGELEWGAAVLAATPEAVFVSLCDNLDAKLGMVEKALRSTPASQAFSDYLAGLGACVLTTPVQAAQTDAASSSV